MERKALGIQKPSSDGKTATRSTKTQVSPSETREPRSDIEEKLHQLSSVPRDLIRKLTTKTLRLLKLQTEIHGDGDAITVPGVEHIKRRLPY